MKNARWTDAELQVLRDGCAAGDSTHEVAARLPLRSFDAVRVRVQQLRRGVEISAPTPPILAEGEPPPRPDPTNVEILRLETKNRQLDQELRDTRAKLAKLRDEGVLFGLLAEAIQQYVEAMPVVTPTPKLRVAKRSPHVDEDVVLLFSDAHADKVVLPERVLGFENYNWQVFCSRFQVWVDSILNWTQQHLDGHSFGRLWVFALGDNMEGNIHGAEKHTAFQNCMKGALAVGDVLAQGIADLSAVFREVIVISVPGNHPRFSKGYDWRGAHENFDYLVATQVATRLANYVDAGRVEIHAPDSFQAAARIRGWNFLLSHGHDVKGWNSIPWYGLERKTRRMQALFSQSDHPLHYTCFGHFHAQATTPIPGGESFHNGAWFATDEFAVDVLADAKRPMQLMFGVHEERGVTWRLPIHVKPPGGDDLEAPCRYNQRVLVDVAQADRAARELTIPVIRRGDA